MANLKTDLNVAPYYDDYDDNKQYYKILFRPGVALQARELTQMQTMLQQQVARFGNSIYKDGTIIEGCNFTFFPRMRQIKFKDSNSSTLDFGTIAGRYEYIANSYVLVSNTTGVRAQLFEAMEGAESVVNQGLADTNRAYITYINVSNSTGVQVETFSSVSEQIDVYSANQDSFGPLSSSNKLGSIYTLSSNSTVNAHGIGVGLHVGTGIVFQKGFFQKTKPVNFIVKEHVANAAGMRVGFDTTESIVKPSEDSTLYDNSIGSTNYSAPGAYRLKLNPTPIFYDASNTSVSVPPDFLPVVEFDGGDGRIVEMHKDPQLNLLGDIMAKRTFEESGDYVVKAFQVDVQAHESNNYQFYYVVSPGIAYVDGYRVELLSPRRTVVDRAISTNTSIGQPIRINYGNYVYVNEFVGVVDTQNVEEVSIYDSPQETLSLYQARTTPSGSEVGKCNIRAVQYHDNTKGIASEEYIFFIFNVRMNAGKNFATDAKSFYCDGAYTKIYADIKLNIDGKAEIVDSNLAKALYGTGVTGVKRLTDSSGTNDTSFIYSPVLTASLIKSTPQSYGTFTTTGTDIFNYGVGFLTDVESENLNIYFAQDTFSNTLSSNTYSNNDFANATHMVLTSTTDTYFAGGLYVGSGIYCSNGGTVSYHTVTNVNSTNSIFVTPNNTPIGQLSIKQFWKEGTPVDFTGSGNTIEITSSTSATVNIEIEPDGVSYDLYGTIPIKKNQVSPVKKVVHKGSYVAINCASHYAGTTGPWCLGLPDVYSVSNVFFGGTFSETNADKSEWFYLDSGQDDVFYGMSYLKLNPKYKNNITSGDRLLVKVNHFTPNATSTQTGFFSVDSYPIDDANTANTNAIQTAQIPFYTDRGGNVYDLRNHIDFRQYLAPTANITTTLADVTINPANNISSFNLGGVGAQVVIETGTNFTYNVEYYLPRKDLAIITRLGDIQVKLGVPDKQPQTPSINKMGMVVAEVFVPPYPSLTFTEAE